MATEAQRRANREQDKTRKADKVRLTAEAIAMLDALRGENPRATYLTKLLTQALRRKSPSR